MIIVYIAIICAIIGFIVGYCDCSYIGDGVVGSIAFLFIGFALGMTVLVVGGLSYNDVPAENRESIIVEDHELIALRDNFNIEGHGFLFSSYIDEDLYYVYLYEGPRGITSGKVKAENTYIKYLENEDETPYIIKYMEQHKNHFLNHLWFWGETYYTIYLPQGSVIENVYEVDLS